MAALGGLDARALKRIPSKFSGAWVLKRARTTWRERLLEGLCVGPARAPYLPGYKRLV